MHPAVSHVFHGPGCSWSMFVRVQVLLGPSPGSRSRIWVQVLEVAQLPFFKSSVFACSDQIFDRLCEEELAIQLNQFTLLNMTNIAWSFNALPPGSRWFCQIRIWSALRKELPYERSRPSELLNLSMGISLQILGYLLYLLGSSLSLFDVILLEKSKFKKPLP